MSQALFSHHDVVRMICRELRPVYRSKDLPDCLYHEDEARARTRREAKQNLASTAQASRILSEHALDALWEVLEDIEPLFRVLPSYTNKCSFLDIFMAIKQEHWNRLLKYSSRVKELHFDGRNSDALHDCILPILSAKGGGVASFFPRLQRLRPLFLRAKNAAHIFPLLYPGLQSFAASFDVFKDHTGGANEELFGTVLAALSLSCNGDGLRELVLFHEGCASFNVREAHVKCLASFPHLQRFVSQAPLEPAAWMNIGLLRRLKYLDVSLDLYPSKDVIPTGKTHALELSGLESLTLRGSLTNTSQFLSQMQASTLRSATFLLDSSSLSPVHCAALESFLCSIQYALPHTLLSFALTCKSMCDVHRFDGPFHVKLWGPLSFFTELQELSIDLSDSPILVSDTEISTLSGALPRLRSLALLYAYGYSDSMRIRLTIKALVALATGCPDLAYLHLANLNVHTPVKGNATPVEGDATPVEEDATPVEEDAETTEPEVPALRHRLRVLEIDYFYAKLSNVSYFFLQLHRLFPEVETMGPRDDFESKAKKICEPAS